jgi:hypothetical protein
MSITHSWGAAQHQRLAPPTIARLMWTRNYPNWHFDDATFDRSAAAFDNPDYVDVVITRFAP